MYGGRYELGAKAESFYCGESVLLMWLYCEILIGSYCVGRKSQLPSINCDQVANHGFKVAPPLANAFNCLYSLDFEVSNWYTR